MVAKSQRRYRAERRNALRRVRPNGKLGGIGPNTLRQGPIPPDVARGAQTMINPRLGPFYKDV